MGLKNLLKNLFRQTVADVQPTLDLHGLSVKEALRMTEDFVAASARAGVSPVRIVYGKGLNSPSGKGILREVIPRWCQTEGKVWVSSMRREVDGRGGDGTILLFLRTPNDPESESPKNVDKPSSHS